MTTRRGASMVTVTVRRAGGISGIVRTWHAEVPETELPSMPDVAAEPGIAAEPGAGADRFVWTITVTRQSAAHDVEPTSVDVPEQRVDDDLRALIDRVRDEGRPVRKQR